MSSASLKAERSRVISQRDSYVSRKRQVDAILNNTCADVALKPCMVNNAITDVESYYKKAIKGKSNNLSFSIEETVQTVISSDYYMSQSVSKLQGESSHCQSKINALNARIEQLNQEIAAAEAAEAEAARREAEAAAAAAAARRAS